LSRSLSSELQTLRRKNLRRVLRPLDSAQAVKIHVGGGALLNFSSNDYLGLSNEPWMKKAACDAVKSYGTGSGASRLVCGTLPPHVALEAALAVLKKTEAALSFSSGYATAVGVLTALCGKEDVIVLDKLCHASLIDGARLSGAVLRIFPHNHVGKLESHLDWAREHHPEARVVVVTESVFSMDGDRAPLAEIVEIKNRHGAMLLLDEAHAIGVLGDHGRGLAQLVGISAEVDIHMGTLSKALGGGGGYVAGSRDLIDLLINRARSFVYSTAPAPATAAAGEAAVQFLLMDEGEERRQQLAANIRLLAAGLPKVLRQPGKIQSAIIPLIIGDERAAMVAARWLRREGFWVPAIRYPTVSRGEARLRVTLTALHTKAQIDALCLALHRLAERLRARKNNRPEQ